MFERLNCGKCTINKHSQINDIIKTITTLGGEVTDTGDTDVTDRGVCRSITPILNIADNYTENGTETSVFESFITGLTANIPYYVRAYTSTV